MRDGAAKYGADKGVRAAVIGGVFCPAGDFFGAVDEGLRTANRDRRCVEQTHLDNALVESAFAANWTDSIIFT